MAYVSIDPSTTAAGTAEADFGPSVFNAGSVFGPVVTPDDDGDLTQASGTAATTTTTPATATTTIPTWLWWVVGGLALIAVKKWFAKT